MLAQKTWPEMLLKKTKFETEHLSQPSNIDSVDIRKTLR